MRDENKINTLRQELTRVRDALRKAIEEIVYKAKNTNDPVKTHDIDRALDYARGWHPLGPEADTVPRVLEKYDPDKNLRSHVRAIIDLEDQLRAEEARK